MAEQVSAGEPPAAPQRLVIRTIGKLTVRVGEREIRALARKSRALLTYLALSETGEETRERLVGLLWSETAEDKARASLRQALREIRETFAVAGFHGLTADKQAIRIDLSQVAVDLWEVFAEAEAGRAHAHLAQTERPLERLLEELESVDAGYRVWLLAKRRTLTDRLRFLLETPMREAAKPRLQREALARGLMRVDPTHEEAARLLIRVRAEAGDIGGALGVYKGLWDLLEQEYDSEPSKETQELIAAIKLGQPLAVAALEAPRTVIVAEAVPARNAAPDVQQLEALVRALIGPYGGRLTVREGSTYILDFPEPRAAVNAAFGAARAEGSNIGQFLRMGAHAAGRPEEPSLPAKEIAGQLATLAEPGELLVSEQVRDVLTDGLDALIEDTARRDPDATSQLRAYRVMPPAGYLPQLPAEILPAVAIIPFELRTKQAKHSLIGEVVAEELISRISATKELAVISRLSTRALRGRSPGLDDVRERLQASYVLSGTYHVRRTNVELSAEFADARSGKVLWARDFTDNVNAILNGNSELIAELVAAISASILTHELQRVQIRPLQTVENYSLLMAAINLSHRASRDSFERARGLLELLVERLPSHPLPLAWLAKWHVFKSNQGWSEDRAADAQQAFDLAARAIDADPECSIALTVDAWAHLHLLKRFDTADQRFELAVEANPNDSIAWLLKGTMHAFKGQGRAAVAAAERAIRLSPLDPRRSYYDSLAATAYNSAGDFERGVQLAERSLRIDRLHASTLRTLAVAQVLSGREGEAKQTVAELLRLDPTLTVSKYLSRHPAAEFATGKLWAETLRRAGLPS